MGPCWSRGDLPQKESEQTQVQRGSMELFEPEVEPGHHCSRTQSYGTTIWLPPCCWRLAESWHGWDGTWVMGAIQLSGSLALGETCKPLNWPQASQGCSPWPEAAPSCPTLWLRLNESSTYFQEPGSHYFRLCLSHTVSVEWSSFYMKKYYYLKIYQFCTVTLTCLYR